MAAILHVVGVALFQCEGEVGRVTIKFFGISHQPTVLQVFSQVGQVDGGSLLSVGFSSCASKRLHKGLRGEDFLIHGPLDGHIAEGHGLRVRVVRTVQVVYI